MEHRALLRRNATVIVPLLRAADCAISVIAGFLAYAAVFGFQRPPDAYQLGIAVQGLIVLLLFPSVNVYGTYRGSSLLAPAAKVISAWLVAILIFLALVAFVGRREPFSRLWIIYWIGIGAVCFALLRMVAYTTLRALRRSGRNLKNVILIGDGPLATQLAERIVRESWMGFRTIAQYPGPSTHGETQSKALEEFSHTLAEKTVDEVWIVVPLEQGGFVKTIHSLAQKHAVTVRYAPDLEGMFLLNHGVTELAGSPMIDLTANPQEGIHGLLKTTEDRLLAAVAITALAPLMAVIAAAIKLTSRGPVLFRQRRHGWGGEEIVIYKFRTMREQPKEAGLVIQAKREDPRVTRVGRFLRRTSLDELPQLINVLQGSMSLVGPRPHACEHNDLYCRQIEGYMLRHNVRPGITGWAQVNGLRGETDTLDKMKQRVKYDLFYIEHWSLWLDLKILVMTLVRGFNHPNAY